MEHELLGVLANAQMLRNARPVPCMFLCHNCRPFWAERAPFTHSLKDVSRFVSSRIRPTKEQPERTNGQPSHRESHGNVYAEQSCAPVGDDSVDLVFVHYLQRKLRSGWETKNRAESVLGTHSQGKRAQKRYSALGLPRRSRCKQALDSSSARSPSLSKQEVDIYFLFEKLRCC